MRVHILVTCRKPELEAASRLVFKTLRVGFPTADVVVWRNHLPPDFDIQSRGNWIVHAIDTTHWEWVERLIWQEQEPFWILDTDVHFWGPVEGWSFGSAPFAGRLLPQFWDEYAQAIDQPRLHTALMWMDPIAIRLAMGRFHARFPNDGHTPRVNLIHPTVLPIRPGRNLFFDTTALLYQAIGGQAFTEAQLDAFEHMNFGTFADLVLPRLKDGQAMGEQRARFLEHPEEFRGNWRAQELWYAAHRA